jgi:hypothetical protein
MSKALAMNNHSQKIDPKIEHKASLFTNQEKLAIRILHCKSSRINGNCRRERGASSVRNSRQQRGVENNANNTYEKNNLQSVVDAVNDVVSRRGLGGEAGLVLLDDFLLCTGKSREVVNITDGLVWSSGSDLSGDAWVHTRHLKVDTDVGVVDINNLSSSKVLDIFVVTNGVGSRGESSHTSSNSKGGEELTTLGSKLGSDTLGSLWGNECGGDTVGNKGGGWGLVQEAGRGFWCEVVDPKATNEQHGVASSWANLALHGASSCIASRHHHDPILPFINSIKSILSSLISSPLLPTYIYL